VLTVRDKGSSHDWVMWFADLPSSRPWSQIDAHDPPAFRQVRGDEIGSDDHLTSLRADSPSGSAQLASHIAPRAAHDPVTGHTIVATVPTRDCGADCYDVQLRVGYGNNGSWNYTLDEPSTTTSTLPTPTSPDPVDDYSGLTHVAPAVACADDSWTDDHGGNCMIAWVDDGLDHNPVMVARFHLQGDTVVWDTDAEPLEARPVNAERVVVGTDGFDEDWTGALSSHGDLSAVFADGRFFVAMKSADADLTDRVAVVQTIHRDLSSWDTYTVWADHRPVDAPTLMVDPTEDGTEMVLSWTRIDEGL